MMAGGPAETGAESSRHDPALAPWGVREILLALMLTAVALVVVFGVLALTLQALGAQITDENNRASAIALVIAQIVVDAAGIGIAAALSLRKYRRGLGAWGLRRTYPLSVGLCLLTLVASLATFPIYGAIVHALGLEALEPTSNVPDMLVDDRAVLPFAFLLVVIVAPLAEESFFRGFVFNGLRSEHARRAVRSSPSTRGLEHEDAGARTPRGMVFRIVGAGFVSSVMWAAIHSQVGLLIPITVVGLLFALLVARTGSLWNAIAVHASFNAIGFAANVASHGSA